VHSIIRGAVAGLSMTMALVACAQPADETAKNDNEIAARFGDTVITVAEVEEAAGPQLAGLYQQIYQVKEQNLNRMIYDQLLDDAAAAEGLTRADFLDREVTSKLAEPEEAQITQVLNQYRSQLPADEEQARQQVVNYLNQQARARQEAALRDRLVSAADIEILLDPYRVDATFDESNPARGPRDAPVVLIEYTDYQCPYCVRAQATLDAVRERYGDSVVHVFKNLPLAMHQQAKLAAEASLCAADQGMFWELHDWIFANKDNLSHDTITAQAGELGLDLEVFTACVNAGTYRQQVEDETKEANAFGIRGTPGFVINGRVLSGAQPLPAFVAVIDDELKRQGLEIPAPPAPAEEPAETQTTQNSEAEPAPES